MDGRAVEAVSWDSIEKLLDGEVWNDKLLSFGELFFLCLLEEGCLFLSASWGG